MNKEYPTYKYLRDPSISDEKGMSKKSSSDYFPKELISIHSPKSKSKNDYFFSAIQQFNSSWYSSYLHAVSAPILYNYYLGYDVYRFLWIRAFHLPIIITLSNQEGKIMLETKRLSKHPDYNFLSETENRWNDDCLINLEVEITKEISINDWQNFSDLLDKASFWNTNPLDNEDCGLDGSEWIIEGHLKDKYWFVSRWSPNKKDSFRKCGEFLINLSGLDEIIY